MSRTNFQVKAFTYVGDGTSPRTLSGLFTFKPRFCIIKGGTNVGVWKTPMMGNANAAYLGSNTASTTGIIQEFTTDGIIIGSSSNTNAVGVVYYGFAIGWGDSQNYIRNATHVGDGTTPRNYTGGGLGFTPDFCMIKSTTAVAGNWRTSDMVGDTTALFGGAANQTGYQLALITNGVQLGSVSQVNAALTQYFSTFIKKYSGIIDIGTYVGTGSGASQTINLTHTPGVIIVKNAASANASYYWTSDMGQNNTSIFSPTGPAAGLITAVATNSFTVTGGLNSVSNNFYYITFKEGSHNLPLVRTLI